MDLPVGSDPEWRPSGPKPKDDPTGMLAWLGGLALMVVGPAIDTQADLGPLEGRTMLVGLALWALALLGAFETRDRG